ncbi:reverse transcriptase domain-containing protein [Roseomonas elaeocarpi]
MALLAYLGVSAEELKKIRWFRHRMYQEFNLAKGPGKVRVIHAPDERLKHLQRRILRLLDQLYRVRRPVHGFVADKSVKSNASAHLNKRFILNVDLKDFFPSITENRVIGVLQSLGVGHDVASVIAIICCFNKQLPQGAPTSPVLSNMICFRMDKELLAFAKGTRCIYTRYADDVTFSSYQPLTTLFEGPVPQAGHFSPDLLIPALGKIFINNGFTINPNKAHYADRHSQRMVTGLKINELLNVDRRYVRNLRATLYSVEKLGVGGAQEKYEKDHGGTSSLRAHLEGKISWLRFIRGQTDPVFRSIAVRFNASFPDRKIEVAPTAAEIRDRAVWVVESTVTETQGSAFFLKDVGLVTAAHCVSGEEQVLVYHPSKPANKFEVTIGNIDDHRDLAVLHHTIPETEYFALERSSKPAKVGDETTAIGYPGFGPGDRLNIREGKVNSLPTKRAVELIEVSQKLTQGLSGGPLLNSDNTVIGIVHRGGPSEGRDFAVAVKMLNDWIAEW